MQGEPILFIDINENEKFILTEKGIEILQKIKNKRISVITITGPQRSGKSFLANRILKQMSGFKIGPTTNPCTKGIWLWSEPIEIENETSVLLLDTEGLYSSARNASLDAKIFSLSILISSLFIYNQLGHIDEQSLQNMSLVVDLGKNIQLDNKNTKFRLKDYCPNFIWVLRDFSLDLKNMNSNQYLDQALLPVNGNTNEIQQKNIIRQKIKNYFQQIECQCLVRPINSENLLARIQDQPWDSLRGEFKLGMQQLEQRIFQLVKPKTIQYTVLNGEMFLTLIKSYIEKFNLDQVPEILTSLNIVKEQEWRRIKNILEEEHKFQIYKQCGPEKMPFDVDDLYKKQISVQNYIFDILENNFRHALDWNQIVEMKSSLNEFFKQFNKNIDQQNNDKSLHVCSKLFLEFRNQQQMPSLNFSENPISDYQQKVNNFIDLYQNNAKGLFKFEIMIKNIFQIIFKQFQNYEIDFKEKIKSDQKDQDSIDSNFKKNEKRYKKQIKDYEKYIAEMNEDSQKLFEELAAMKREKDQAVQAYETLYQSNLQQTGQKSQNQTDIDFLILRIENLEKENSQIKQQVITSNLTLQENKQTLQQNENTIDLLEKQQYEHLQLIDAHELMFGICSPQQITKALTIYEKLAEQDQINAINSLSTIYYENKIIPQNIKKCQYYTEKSINQKSAQGWYILGQLFENNHIQNSEEFYQIQKDLSQLKKAIICYETSSQQNHLNALTDLAYLYENGNIKIMIFYKNLKNIYNKHIQGVGEQLQPNIQLSLQFSKKACNENFPRALNNLGLYFIKNDGNKQEAVKLIAKSAQMFYVNALFNLGLCYKEGLGVEKDIDKARSFFKKAEKRGDINGKLACAQQIIEQKSTDEEYFQAYENLMQIKDKTGDIYFSLGHLYQYGLGVSQDYKVALKYYINGSQLNHIKSSSKCGDFYFSGFGTKEPDISTAIQYYLKSAKQGDIESYLNLGAIYEDKKNYDKAIEMFKIVANSGNSLGYYNIALIYKQTGVSLQEIKWNLQKASELGNKDALDLLLQIK